mmetsp:Transcript_1230/g.3571  ORF Transcript_1230/g.3571 Transcript_1230/m.3571 type:complete len:304 (+) Transcript_1230:857-1768(+)
MANPTRLASAAREWDSGPDVARGAPDAAVHASDLEAASTGSRASTPGAPPPASLKSSQFIPADLQAQCNDRLASLGLLAESLRSDASWGAKVAREHAQQAEFGLVAQRQETEEECARLKEQAARLKREQAERFEEARQVEEQAVRTAVAASTRVRQLEKALAQSEAQRGELEARLAEARQTLAAQLEEFDYVAAEDEEERLRLTRLLQNEKDACAELQEQVRELNAAVAERDRLRQSQRLLGEEVGELKFALEAAQKYVKRLKRVESDNKRMRQVLRGLLKQRSLLDRIPALLQGHDDDDADD